MKTQDNIYDQIRNSLYGVMAAAVVLSIALIASAWSKIGGPLWVVGAMGIALSLLFFIWRLNSKMLQAARDARIKDTGVASSINAIAMASLDGRIFYVNQSFVELWKMGGPQEAIGHSPLEYWDRPEEAQAVVEVLQREGKWQGKLRARLQDGSSADMQLSAFLVGDADGQPLCMMSSFIDITEQVRHAEYRDTLLDQLNATLEAVPDLMFELGLDGTYYDIHALRSELLAAPAEDLPGKTVFDVLPPAAAETVIAVLREANEHGRSFGQQIELDLPQGKSWFELSVARKKTMPGQPPRFIVLSRDITEHVKAVQVLQNHKQVLDAASDGFWMVDMAGNIIESNAAYARMSGYTIEELVGMHISQIESKEQSADEVRTHIAKIIEQGSDRFETRHRRKDGREIELYASVLYLHEAQQFAGFMSDITERMRAERELLRSQKMLNTAERMGLMGSWDLDTGNVVLYWSDEVYSLFELDPAKFQPSYDAFLNAIHPEDRDPVNRAYIRSLETREEYDIKHRLLMADGRIKWVREHCTSDFDMSGKPLRSVGAIQDITMQKRTEERLREAAVAFETHEAIMVTDSRPVILRVNRAFTTLTGYSEQDVLGKNPHMLSSGRQGKSFYQKMWASLLEQDTWSGELWDRHKDGHEYPKWLTISAVQNVSGETTGYVGIFTDMTERKQAEEDIYNLAFYDSLTRLANRRLLMDRIHQALSQSARNKRYGALLFLDLDKFKTINDTLGHNYGDQLLIDTSVRLKECVREVDTVSRLGGDEFVLLVEDIAADAQEASQKIMQIAEKILAALAMPYRIFDTEYRSSTSIGVCLFQGTVQPVETLLKFADLAMYHAKDAGRNTVRFFDPRMQEAVEKHAALESDLRGAVSAKQFVLYYQVQVDNDHRVIGAEALLRWLHPKRGMVSPGLFIPVAEESSLILEIGDWVMDEACRQLAEWKNDLARNLQLAVNVSGQQFRLHNFVELVEAKLRKHSVHPSQLKLELTESVVLSDVADVVKKMHALKAIGVRLSLDDFGTGYSSLSYLKQLPLDQIKIDQSFVRDIATDPNDAVMVQTVIDMAKNFRLNVIAEGVETDAQLAFLRQHGCMAYQGYLFSKPVPVVDFEKLLETLQAG